MPEQIPRFLLFDRIADPYEMSPLICRSPWEQPVMARLHSRLMKHMEETGDLVDCVIPRV